MRASVLISGTFLFGLCVAGCRHQAPALALGSAAPPRSAPAAPRTPPPAAAPPRAAAPPPLSEDNVFRRTSLDQLNAQHPLGDVFVDYQQDTIRDEGLAVLHQDAAWLERWPGTRISIEGHCDERGSSEYNLALGDRRAEAVKNYFVNLGIPGDRLTVKSLGKEAPFCADSGEACWSQNRRDHFVITAK